MTSSLKNSVHRRNHKERSQLAHRAKLGILEKHKDYVKRARDYHSKQDRLTRLKQKAAERNKDEFYFAMRNERTKGGVHIKDRGNTALPTDVVKVLKTQDENYVRTMRAAGRKKIDKLKAQLTAMADLMKPFSLQDDSSHDLEPEEVQVLQDAGVIPRGMDTPKSSRRAPKHIIFVDTEEEMRNYTSTKAGSKQVSTQAEGSADEEVLHLGWKTPTNKRRTKKHKAGTGTSRDESAEHLDQVIPRENRSRLLKELSARLLRDKQLRYAEREFEMQRLMMGKGGRKKIRGPEKVEGDSNSEEDEDEIDARKGRRRKPSRAGNEEIYKPRVYKWRQERKR